MRGRGDRTNIPHGTRRDYRRGCRCQACTAANTRYAAELQANPRPLRYLPFGPLQERLSSPPPEHQAAARRAYYRAARAGQLTLAAAENICEAVGLYPVEVWGLSYYEGEVNNERAA